MYVVDIQTFKNHTGFSANGYIDEQTKTSLILNLIWSPFYQYKSIPDKT